MTPTPRGLPDAADSRISARDHQRPRVGPAAADAALRHAPLPDRPAPLHPARARQAIRLSFQREREGEGDVSRSALTTALAATIGTGNIVGVATAVAAGGPGAVLWMWLTGVFGIATKYAEAVLAVKYRVTMPDGTMAGGPMYVLERGHGRALARRRLRRVHRGRRPSASATWCRRTRSPLLARADVRRVAVDQRRRDDRADGGRHPRRHPVDRARLRGAGAVHGGLLHRSAASILLVHARGHASPRRSA